jgi:NADPH:quinone reductase-like Zn-dependent oxidoreductase
VAKAPTSIPLEHAAALPLAGQTAWQCLLPRLARRPGQRVLIQAGSGGVGHLAIPIAKAHGAWVATTCSPKNHAFVTELGADQAIDYRTQSWWEELSDLDLVLDALGYDERDRALAAVARGGEVASIVTGLPGATERWGPNLGVLAVGLGVARFAARGWLSGKSARTVVKRNRRADLEALARMVDDGTLRPHIHEAFPLDRIGEAHALLDSHRIVGKVLVVP